MQILYHRRRKRAKLKKKRKQKQKRQRTRKTMDALCGWTRFISPAFIALSAKLGVVCAAQLIHC